MPKSTGQARNSYLRRTLRRALALVALTALVLTQVAIGSGGLASSAAAAPPCHMAASDMAPDQSHDPVPADDDGCPLMIGATCLTLCAMIGPLQQEILPLRAPAGFTGARDAAVQAWATSPPRRPPRSL